MELMPISYTIGIKKRWLWPFYHRFTVIGHKNEELCGTVRLHLTLPSGSVIVIPEITKMHMKIFPDYINAQQNLAKLREQKLKDEKQHGEVRV